MTFDIDEINQRLPEYLRRLGWSPTKETDIHLEGPCPIHNGEDSNFHCDRQPDGNWLWICRSQCGGLGGGTIGLHGEIAGRSPNSYEVIAGAAQILGLAGSENYSPTPEELDARRERIVAAEVERIKEQRKARITDKLAARRMGILKPYICDGWRANTWHSSPNCIPETTDEQARLMIRLLFNDLDLIWLGEVEDSGRPEHAANFKTASKWSKSLKIPPRIAAGIFKSGSFSRTADNVEQGPFIVIESDDLIGRKPTTAAECLENKMLCSALFSFLQDGFKMNLRAVVDTGGKSLHGWFDRPSQLAVHSLLNLADGFAIDVGVLTGCSNRPLRLPGCIHDVTKRQAQLLFLNS